MMPSTPRRSALHVRGSLTVQGITWRPERPGLRQRCRGHVAETGRPDGASRGRYQARRRAVEIVDVESCRPRRRAGRPRCRVSPLPPSMVRQTRSISGAIRRMATSVRQSNDCTATRRARSARMASLRRRRRSRGRRVGPEVGRDLGLHVESDVVGLHPPYQVEDLREGRDAGAVDPLLPGNRRGVGRAGLEAADVVALELGQGQGVDGGPRAARNLPSGPRV